jgi:glycosyltransferase involved in cell wall biosynthesis
MQKIIPKNNDLVSIIVPIYNVEDYLERCIESLANQTYTNLEIILVDDGSTDNCGKMCDELAKRDNRINVIHKKNGGLSDARNVGFSNATGKYAIFIDSDDYVDIELISDCVSRIENDNSDMVVFDFKRVEGKDIDCITLIDVKEGCYNLSEKPQLLIGSPAAWNKFFKKEFLNATNIQFPVGKYYEDLGTTPKFLASAKRISYIKKPYYYYMIRSGSIMSSGKFEKNFNDRTEMIDGVLRYFKEKNLYEKYKNELEFLTLFNGYFLPSREIILADRKNKILGKFRKYIYTRFPTFAKNPYIKTQLSKKDRLHLWTINARQYWVMVLLSKLRKMKEKIVHG